MQLDSNIEKEELVPGQLSSSDKIAFAKELVPDVDSLTSVFDVYRKMAEKIITETGDMSCILPLTARIKGQPYSLLNFPMFVPLFNVKEAPMRTTYQCCRQVGKTETLSSSLCVKGAARDNYNALVVAPRHEQALRISGAKTKPFLKESLDAPIPNFYVEHERDITAKEITFRNGNTIYFIGCYQSPDPARGISVEAVYYDEMQDMDPTFVPVINQCKASSVMYGEEYYFGTPKSTYGPLTELFMDGSQAYWAVNCSKCGKENWANDEVDDDGKYACERLIGKDGPTCLYCQNVFTYKEVLHTGRYKHRYPERLKDREGPNGELIQAHASYHICQAFHPAHMTSRAKWSELYACANGSMDRITFLNECCGIAADRGNILITPAQLREACSDDEEHKNELPLAAKRIREFTYVPQARKQKDSFRRLREITKTGGTVYMGIDWSGHGGEASNSYTSIVFVGNHPSNEHQFETFYMERLSKDMGPEQTAMRVARLYESLKPSYIIHDQTGAGLAAEVLLRRRLKTAKIIGISYVGSGGNMKNLTTFQNNPETHRSGLTIAKTRSLEMMYALVKAGYVQFPYETEQSWALLEDFLNIQRQSTIGKGDSLDRHTMILLPGKSDDIVHAFNLAITFALHKLGSYPDVYKSLLGGSFT